MHSLSAGAGPDNDDLPSFNAKSLYLPRILAEITEHKQKANSEATACALFHRIEEDRLKKPLRACRPRSDMCPVTYCRVHRQGWPLPEFSSEQLCIDDYATLGDGKPVNTAIMNSFITLLNKENFYRMCLTCPSGSAQGACQRAEENLLPYAYVCSTLFLHC